VRLARWVDAQRQAHRLGKLSGPRSQALESMPAWKWTVTKRYGWDSNLQSYADFIRVNGNRPTLDGERSDEWRLYKWLVRQREAAARGDLTSHHSLALTASGRVGAWGFDYKNVLDVPTEARSGVTAISASDMYSLALTRTGRV